jgi:hypothetical protein
MQGTNPVMGSRPMPQIIRIFYCRVERDREMVKDIHAKLDLMIENQKNAKR